MSARRCPKAAAREAEVQRDVELAIGAEPDLVLLRNTVGTTREFDDDGNERFITYGLLRGSPDLVGILAPRGRWFALECKRPDENPTTEQRRVHALWRRFGAYVATVHSAAEARAALEEARKEEAA